MLAERLRELIRARGPIPFRDWMEAALYDPEGYYNRSDLKRWGREADYRTSAERSELFSATFARYFARLYEELGGRRPGRWLKAVRAMGGLRAECYARGPSVYPQVLLATQYYFEEQVLMR